MTRPNPLRAAHTRLARFRRRYLPAGALVPAAYSMLFSWSGMLGTGLLAAGLALLWWSAWPVVIAGALELVGVAISNYLRAMQGLAPSLSATDEDREVAKLTFENALRANHVAGGPPWAVFGAANECARIGVTQDELQAISERLMEALRRAAEDG